MMEALEALDLDTGEVQSYYRRAISAYKAAAASLDRNRVPVQAARFGQGFAAEGAQISEALDSLHATTLAYLDARVRSWNSILELSDAVRERDEAGGEQFGEVRGL